MKRSWWKEAVVYQVYWRSFHDTNGDGFGDLQGVVQKLDYIKSLGVDVVWLNPCFESPDADNGYDIQDYYSIMSKAGTLDIFKDLLFEVHQRGMRLIMDLVVNHTSDQHPWFVESRSSKNHPKRDYYIWRSGKQGKEPNNWRSYFTPSTWEYDPHTDEYYFHSFATEQPDLNWENSELRQEIYQMMRFWLDMGIDGFRLDAIALLAKQAGFPDAEDPYAINYLCNNEETHRYLQEMNEQVFRHYDILTVGETAFVTPEVGLLYVGEERNELNMLFHFEVCDAMPTWDMTAFKDIQERWYKGLWNNGWNAQFLNNHDHTRQVTRYGNDKEFRVESAKLLATMVHTLPGTPYIYQGEEIGMTGVNYTSIDDYKDIAFRNKFEEEVATGRSPEEVFEALQPLARDNSRSPMQWNRKEHGGFTTGEPWLKVNPNYLDINVEEQVEDPQSVLSYYKSLIHLRKQNPVMVYGDYNNLSGQNESLYVYTRTLGDVVWLIMLNHSDTPNLLVLPQAFASREATLILGNYPDADDAKFLATGELRPHEARIYELQSTL